jgi:hypothetical protein
VDLGKHLLQNNPEQRLSIAFIGALSNLAKRNKLILSKHITLILDEIARISDNESLLICYLSNLLELTEAPYYWTEDQVQVSAL